MEVAIKAPQFTPSPLNLFMNIPVHDDYTTLSFEAPTSKEGQYISLKAEMDLVIAFSACPQVSIQKHQWYEEADLKQDILKINCGKPVDAHFQIL
jgi:uncharacterized protein